MVRKDGSRMILGAVLVLGVVLGAVSARAQEPATEGKGMHIIVFGAHPDDCELRAGGVAAKWAALGHKVKFVSVTNGDVGHYKLAGGPLAQRRAAEVKEAARILGIETQVLDHHDGELMPTLDIRLEIIRLIREWNADIVITHRPNDYHPDHRYTGVLVQDAAFMVTVPFICPDTPRLEKNPVFLYMSDRFTKPIPFEADVVVAIDDVIEKKLDALSVITSQFLEWSPWHSGRLDEVPKEATAAKAWVREQFRPRMAGPADAYRDQLAGWYGPEKAASIRYAEAFEITEYGRQPSEAELRELFPFFPEKR